MKIMTILGSVLDENSLLDVHDGIARYEVSDDVSRRFVMPEITDQIDDTFDLDSATCDLYISVETFEPLGFRILNGENGKDVFLDNISNSKEECYICKMICQYLGCKAITESVSF